MASQKNNKSKADVTPENKDGKKLTRYDLKMQRRAEEERRKKRNRKIGIGCVIAACAAAAAGIGYNAYSKYQLKNGAYFTVGSHEITKAEYDYYFYSVYNTFINQYGSYASYFGLDTSEPLDEQDYGEGDLTWKDHFDEQAVEQIKQTYALIDEAEANGFTHDDSAAVDEMKTTLQSSADSQGESLDEYITSTFGEYATIDKIQQYYSNSLLADAYYNSISDSTEVSSDEIQSYYDENKDDYDSVDYRICEIDANIPEADTTSESDTEAADETDTETEAVTETETVSESESEAQEEMEEEIKQAAMDEAKSKADEMVSGISDDASFDSIYSQYASDSAAQSVYTDAKKADVSQASVAQWLFDASRQAGDIGVVEDDTNNAYYVVIFDGRYLDEKPTVDFRHILISADMSEDETETAGTGTDETETAAAETDTSAETELTETETAAETETVQAETETETASETETEASETTADGTLTEAAAESKANDIYQEWLDGDKTEDSFADLANQYSDDTGSNTNGGLYEGVADGDMVETVNDWLFADGRQAGDTGVISSDYGYHIMYFVGADDLMNWQANIKDTLVSDKMQEYMENLTAGIEVKDPHHHLDYIEKREKMEETDTSQITESEADTETAAETETVSETETAAETEE